MVEYSVLVDIGSVDPEEVDTEPFDLYAGYLRTTGTTEVVVTLPAAGLLQAVTTALAVVTVAGHEARAVRALPAVAFTAREELDPGCTHLDPAIPTVTVEQAAARLGTSPQAVTKRLRSGSLPGTKDGRDWRVLQHAVDQEVARWREATMAQQQQVARTAMVRLLADQPDSTDDDLTEAGLEAVTCHPKFCRDQKRRRSWYPLAGDTVDRTVADALEACRTAR